MIVLVKMDTDKGLMDIPYALLFLGSALEKAGYDVKVFHQLSSGIDKITKFVKNNNPLFVGVSTCTGPTTKLTADLSKSIKSVCDVPIVWGGVHPSIFPWQTLAENYVDIVVVGEDKNNKVDLANAIKKKKDLSKVKGVGYKKNGKIIINPSRPLESDLGKFDIAWHLVNLESYIKNRDIRYNSEKMLIYIASRGCPYRCGFCYNPMFNRGTWRPFPTKKVVSDILMLKQEYDIDGVVFWDDNFFVDKRRSLDILKEIDLPWYGDIRANYIDDSYAKKLVQYKCNRLLVGAESGSDRILKLIRKGLTTKELISAYKVCKKNKIPISYSFVVGFPTETWQDSLDTVKFIFKLIDIYPDNPVGPIMGVYMPYPGSDLYDVSVKLGFKPPSRTEDWGVFNRYAVDFDLPWVDNKKMDALIKGYDTWTSSCITKTSWRYDLMVMKKIYEARVNNSCFFAPHEIYLHRGLRDYTKKLLVSLGLKLPSGQYFGSS